MTHTRTIKAVRHIKPRTQAAEGARHGGPPKTAEARDARGHAQRL